MSTAFQGNAFQGNAFQVGSPTPPGPPPTFVQGWETFAVSATLLLTPLISTYVTFVPTPPKFQSWEASVRAPTIPGPKTFADFTIPPRSSKGWESVTVIAPVQTQTPRQQFDFVYSPPAVITVFAEGWQSAQVQAPPPPAPYQPQYQFVYPSTVVVVTFAEGWQTAQAQAPRLSLPFQPQYVFVVPPKPALDWRATQVRVPQLTSQPQLQSTFVPSPFVAKGWEAAQATTPQLSPVPKQQYDFVYKPTAAVVVVYAEGWQTVVARAVQVKSVAGTQAVWDFSGPAGLSDLGGFGPTRIIRDPFDRDDWGRFIPGAGVRYT